MLNLKKANVEGPQKRQVYLKKKTFVDQEGREIVNYDHQNQLWGIIKR